MGPERLNKGFFEDDKKQSCLVKIPEASDSSSAAISSLLLLFFLFKCWQIKPADCPVGDTGERALGLF